jgi:hypothetical protein
MQVTLINSMGTDQTVVDAARVSFAKKADNYTEAQNEKLIQYLARHNHWTPFGHAQVTFLTSVRRRPAPILQSILMASPVRGQKAGIRQARSDRQHASGMESI